MLGWPIVAAILVAGVVYSKINNGNGDKVEEINGGTRRNRKGSRRFRK